MPQPPTARDALDAMGLDAICDRIINGDSVRQICLKEEIGVASFWKWVASDAERSARVTSARVASAATLEEDAGSVLEDKQIPVDRAREIASHKRWQAKIRNPRQYGEKLELSGGLDIQNLSEQEVDARAAAIAARLAALGPVEGA